MDRLSPLDGRLRAFAVQLPFGYADAPRPEHSFSCSACGYWRAYNTPEESFWCCTGSGAEEFAKFSDTIYFHRGSDLYVNHFVPRLSTGKKKVSPSNSRLGFRGTGTTLKVKSSRPAARAIHVRIPGWTTAGAEVKINGRALKAIADPGSYLALRRVWRDGDTITLRLPMDLWEEALPGEDTSAPHPQCPLCWLQTWEEDCPMQPAVVHDPFPKEIPAAYPIARVKADQDAKTSQRMDSTGLCRGNICTSGQTPRAPNLS